MTDYSSYKREELLQEIEKKDEAKKKYKKALVNVLSSFASGCCFVLLLLTLHTLYRHNTKKGL